MKEMLRIGLMIAIVLCLAAVDSVAIDVQVEQVENENAMSVEYEIPASMESFDMLTILKRQDDSPWRVATIIQNRNQKAFVDSGFLLNGEIEYKIVFFDRKGTTTTSEIHSGSFTAKYVEVKLIGFSLPWSGVIKIRKPLNGKVVLKDYGGTEFLEITDDGWVAEGESLPNSVYWIHSGSWMYRVSKF